MTMGALILITALVAACGGTPVASPSSRPDTTRAPANTGASQPSAAKSTALKNVSFRLDYILGDYEVPTVLAKANGYYRDEGLNVSIGEGKGSASTIELVAQGHDDFGLADAATTALSISKGVPVITIATFIQETPDAFIVHDPSQAINRPEDLIGKSIIQTPGGSTFTLLPAVLHGSGVRLSDLKIVTVAPGDKYSAFLTTPNSVYTGYYPDDLIKLREQDPQATSTSFAKFGVNPLSVNLVTSLSMVKDHPDTVRAFVAAAVKGYEAAQRDPAAAIAAGRAEFPDALVSTDGLKAALTMLHSPATQGKPIGWMAADDWRETVDLMHQYGGLKTVKPLEEYYTNAFIPGGTS